MKSAERKWLALLAAVVAAAFTSIDAYLAQEDKAAAKDYRIRLGAELKKKRLNEEDRAAIRGDIARLKGGAAEKDAEKAADPVALGSSAKSEFARNGLETKGYSVAQGKRASVVEFEIEGEASGISALLSSESQGKTDFSISRFSVSKTDRPGRLQAIVGVSPKRIYSQSANPREAAGASGLIATVAGKAPAPKALRSAAPPATPAPSPRTDRVQWISYIGKTTLTDGTVQYFLKDNKAGSMLELRIGRAGDAVLSEAEDAITIRYQGATYEIRK